MNFKLNIIIPVLFILVVGSFMVFSFRSPQSSQDVIDNNIKTTEAVDGTIGIKNNVSGLKPAVTITSATCKIDSTEANSDRKFMSVTANGTMKGSPGDLFDAFPTRLGMAYSKGITLTAVSVDCGSWSRTENERYDIAACIREEGQPESSVWSLKWINLSSYKTIVKGELTATAHFGSYSHSLYVDSVTQDLTCN